MPKRLLSGILFILPCFLLFCSSQVSGQSQVIILQYHHVSTATPPVTSLSPDAFEEHMQFLERNNFTVLALEDALQALQTGSPLPGKSAVITFDDGYTSVYETAFPVLQELNWPFTVFITTGLVGSNDNLYATWEQIREMAEGGATIANHTVTHPYLLERQPGDNEDQWLQLIRNEILEAEAAIENETGQRHQIFAYPYGEYNPEIQTLVQDLGFIGIAQHSGPVNAASDFTALPRFPFSGIYASMNTFPIKVMSLAFTLDNFLPPSPITNEQSPEATLDFSDNQNGLAQLSCFNNNEMIAVELVNPVSNLYRVSSHIENRSRRFRYNCTAPNADGRYYWYSIPWVNPSITE